MTCSLVIGMPRHPLLADGRRPPPRAGVHLHAGLRPASSRALLTHTGIGRRRPRRSGPADTGHEPNQLGGWADTSRAAPPGVILSRGEGQRHQAIARALGGFPIGSRHGAKRVSTSSSAAAIARICVLTRISVGSRAAVGTGCDDAAPSRHRQMATCYECSLHRKGRGRGPTQLGGRRWLRRLRTGSGTGAGITGGGGPGRLCRICWSSSRTCSDVVAGCVASN
jgi:hypothetical protein